VTDIAQIDLPLGRASSTPPEPEKRDHEANWRAFLAEHPEAGEKILVWCRDEKRRGETRISMARCWEQLRGTLGKGVKLDNSWRRPAAFWAMAQDATLSGLIPVKGRAP
jgi:hypothetical protein